MNFLKKILGSKPALISENSELVAAMDLVARHDSTEARKRLYGAFLQSRLWVPTPELPPGFTPGMHAATGGTKFQVTGFTRPNGVRATTVFTDAEALRNWDPNTPSFCVGAKEFFAMISRLSIDEVVVNPFDPIRKMIRPTGNITRKEFEMLARGESPAPNPGMLTTTFKAGTKMNFGAPAKPLTAGTLEAIARLLSAMPIVVAAFHMAVSFDSEAPHRAIAIHTESGSSEEQMRNIAKGIIELVRPELSEGEPFDVMPASKDFYSDPLRTVKPFFVRPEPAQKK